MGTPAFPAQPVKLESPAGDREALGPQPALGRQGLGRARDVHQQPAAVARKVVVQGQVRVVANATFTLEGTDAPLLHEELEVSINRAERHARQLAAHGLIDPFGRRMRLRAADGLEHEAPLPGGAAGRRGGRLAHISNNYYY
jgi:hypothetical protein